MNQPELFSRVVQLSKVTVDAVDPSVLGDSTPCADWNVRQLINHMAITLRYSRAVIEKGDPAEDRLSETDVLGSGWKASYATAADAATEAFTTAGAMERQVNAPVGEVPGAFWVDFPTWDIYLHSWDLAKATNQTLGASDELTKPILAWGERIFTGPRDLQQIGEVIETAIDATDMDRLVAFFGRTP